MSSPNHQAIELTSQSLKSTKSTPRRKRNVTIFEEHDVAEKEPQEEDSLYTHTIPGHKSFSNSNRSSVHWSTTSSKGGQFSHAICTLLPSRRSNRCNAYCILPASLAHTVTLPRNMERIHNSQDPVVISIRRQLSSASHNLRFKTVGSRPPRLSYRTTGPRGFDDLDRASGDAESFISESGDSENIFWERLAAIRDMPLPLDVKRQYRNKLVQHHEKPVFGLNVLDLKPYKAKQHVIDTMKEVLGHLTVWSKSLKKIEGYYGTGVVSYFLFLRWLIFMNIFILAILLTFVIIPQMLNTPPADGKLPFKDNSTNEVHSTIFRLSEMIPIAMNNETKNDPDLCFRKYKEEVQNNTQSGVGDQVLGFLQGTGWLELTYAFIGNYEAETKKDAAFLWEKYNLPLAYLFSTLACFLLCLILMVSYTAEGFRETLMNRGNFHQYCNMVFSGWDYCISEDKTAQLKHSSVAQELKSHLAEERRKAELAGWSRAKKASVFTIRTSVNIVVLVILVAALYLIFYVAQVSVEYSTGEGRKATEGFQGLMMEFLPSITISGLNFVIPFLYNIMIGFENYSTDVKIKVSLTRTVLLRMASILVLLMSFYFEIEPRQGSSRKKCWETYVGQQMYKLAIFDFLIVCGMTFLVEFPRMLLVKHWVNKFTQFIGFQEFDISTNVLHIVYAQTICWLGMFYCPFLPCLSVIKYIIFFYLRKFSLMVNCRPSQNAYRASRSNAIFMLVLMFAFLISVIPLGVSVGVLNASQCCGPFRTAKSMWDPVVREVENWPKPVKVVKDTLFSTGFEVAAFIGLSLVIYYYSTVSSAREERIRVLKEQLILEGKDKQFLLQRVDKKANALQNDLQDD